MKKIDAKQIEILKSDPDIFFEFVQTSDEKSIKYVLGRLGRLSASSIIIQESLFSLLSHRSIQIRVAAAHNVGKFGDANLLPKLISAFESETSTEVRTEIISAIGRMRDHSSLNFLYKTLNDPDPKTVMQAIRGILVFKKDPIVINSLKTLLSHPNEQIQAIIKPLFEGSIATSKLKSKSKEPANYLSNTVVRGDVLEVLAEVADDEIHLTFTSPPYYNARDYSIYESYGEYIAFLKSVFTEIHRVTREGRFLIVNTSPVIVSRFSRSHSSRRYPIPFDIHGFMDEIGWEYIDDIIWLKPEASVKNRNGGFLQHRKPLGYKPNTVTEMLMVYRKKTIRLIDWNMKQYSSEIIEQSLVPDGYETTNVWRIDPKYNKIHSAVFPIELCEKIISYYSFKGDIVFDPFAGSGTLGKAALALGRSFFLTELNEKYFQLMKDSLPPNENMFTDKSFNKIKFISSDDFRNVEK